jgi:hypothetical protein
MNIVSLGVPITSLDMSKTTRHGRTKIVSMSTRMKGYRSA